MSPDLPHNSWGIFKAQATPRDAVGKIVIYHHHSIDDAHFGKRSVTIRRFQFEKVTPDGSLFDKLVVTLSGNSSSYPPYALNDITSDEGVEIAGVMIECCRNVVRLRKGSHWVPDDNESMGVDGAPTAQSHKCSTYTKSLNQ